MFFNNFGPVLDSTHWRIYCKQAKLLNLLKINKTINANTISKIKNYFAKVGQKLNDSIVAFNFDAGFALAA